MEAETYDIVATNQIINQRSRDEVKQSLMTTLKMSEVNVERILGTQRTVIKKSAEKNIAEKYQSVLERCGILCELEPVGIDMSSLEIEPVTEAPINSIEATQSPYDAPQSTLAEKEMVFCRECGNSMHRENKRCDKCGAVQQIGPGRGKVAAGFLAFFLGAFGIHRFYLGQWWGVFYILLMPFGISGLVSLVEAIVFWCTSQEKWNEKYGHLPPANGWLIFAIAILPIIAFIGILAAIALPAYQDYTFRAKVHEGIIFSQPVRNDVEDFMSRVGFIPSSNLDANLPQDISNEVVESVMVSTGGSVVVTYRPFSSNQEAYNIIFTPSVGGGEIEWSCLQGTMPEKYRPSDCKE